MSKFSFNLLTLTVAILVQL